MSSSYWYKNDDLVILTHRDLKQDESLTVRVNDLTRYNEELREECDELRTRTENNETTISTLMSVLNNQSTFTLALSRDIEEMKQSQKLTEQHLVEQSIRISKLEKEWAQTTNRLLEAETNLERTKNILVRKHISFPFISDMKL